MDKGDIEAHHKLEELEKTLEEVDKAMTEPTKEVPEENIREDYTHYVLASLTLISGDLYTRLEGCAC